MNEYNWGFLKLLREIKKKPPMFIGEVSIRNLHTFLLGYNFARYDLQVIKTAEEKQFQGFPEWLQKKYNVRSTESWAKIILSQENNEADAFYKFFELLDEFLEE